MSGSQGRLRLPPEAAPAEGQPEGAAAPLPRGPPAGGVSRHGPARACQVGREPCRRLDRLGGYTWSKAGIWKIVDRGLSKASGQAPDRGVTCVFGAPRGIRIPNRQIRSLVLYPLS